MYSKFLLVLLAFTIYFNSGNCNPVAVRTEGESDASELEEYNEAVRLILCKIFLSIIKYEMYNVSTISGQKTVVSDGLILNCNN